MDDLNLSQTALILSISGLLISFLNVSRQRRGSLKNDQERFKRDLNLQTSDQFIELLHELQEIITKYRVLDKYSPKKNFLENNLSSRSERLKALNDEFWSITESWLAVIRKIDSFYMKRKVLLSSYEKSITKIKDFGDAVEDNLWKLRTSLLEEQYYEEFIMQQIKALKYLADNLLEVINTTINNVQQDFLGKLYKK